MDNQEWTEAYNPFNSFKLFAHVPRWKEIKKEGPLPSPALVTIDPTNICDLDCTWCNSEYLRNKNHQEISKNALIDIADFLPRWGDHPTYTGVPAVCVAGGGEPLLNEHTGDLINRLYENGVGIGVVTNGTHIDGHLEALTNCTWVGVSVDAGTSETYQRLKKRDRFGKVIKNMERLVSLSEGTPLGKEGRGPGVSYKFLMHPENVKDISQAAKIAKEIGCKSLHIRPFGISWDKLGTGHPDEFSYSDIQVFREELEKARVFEEDDFRVYGVTHKFDGDFRKQNQFDSCKAVFMTAVIQPATNPDKGRFNLGLCCDRRGDINLTFPNLNDVEQINQIWGSEEHWRKAEKIKVGNCPRCTYQPHNIIFENVVEEDNTTWEFI